MEPETTCPYTPLQPQSHPPAGAEGREGAAEGREGAAEDQKGGDDEEQPRSRRTATASSSSSSSSSSASSSGPSRSQETAAPPPRPAAARRVIFSRAVEAIGYGRYQRVLLAFAGATQLADAMELLTIAFLARELKGQWGLSKSGCAALELSVLTGMGVGAVSCGLISDRCGRKAGSGFAVVLTAVFGLMSSLASSFSMLLALRFFVGVGVGSAPAPLGLYAEFLPPRERGRELVTFFTFFSVGAVLEAFIAWATLGTRSSGDDSWRDLLLVSAMPSVALAICLPFVPESPRYLIASGKQREACEALRRVARVNGTVQRVPWDFDTVVFVLDDAIRIGQGGGLAVSAGGEEATGELEQQSLSSWGDEQAALIANNGTQPRPLDGAHHHPQSRMLRPLVDQDGNGPLLDAHDDGSVPSRDEEENEEDGKHRSGSGNVSGWAERRRGTLGLLLGDPKRLRATAMIGTMFFIMAALYYSIVLVSNELVAPPESSSDEGPKYPPGAFLEIVATNAAELPGLALAWYMLSRLERRRSVMIAFGLCGACMACLLVLTSIGFKALAELWRSVLVFGARGAAQAFNVSLWILTTEYFPTSVRVLGIGITTACARLGSILSPLVAEFVFASSTSLGAATCVAFASLGVLGSAFLPPDTELALNVAHN